MLTSSLCSSPPLTTSTRMLPTPRGVGFVLGDALLERRPLIWSTAGRRTFLVPSRLGCTAEDLYAARCAIVHSGAAESKMSREGKASEIWYDTSPKLPAFSKRFERKVSTRRSFTPQAFVAAFAVMALARIIHERISAGTR
jgi:hypothetical protein